MTYVPTILYIEDNPANLRLVSRLLARKGNYNFLSADEPVQGLKIASESQPDLILVDINLPGMSGYEVLKCLRLQKNIDKTPIIAVSANAMRSDINKGLEAGFKHYITKPIDVPSFIKVISMELNNE